MASIDYFEPFPYVPVLRFVLTTGLFVYIALPRLKTGFAGVINDRAFLFYLMAGFVYHVTIFIPLLVSLTHTSVFISRYLWPSHLLLAYQLLYAYYHFVGTRKVPQLKKLLPVYVASLTALLFYQNQKQSLVYTPVFELLPKLNKNYPLFVESAVHFLPIWFYNRDHQPQHLLDWETASTRQNTLGATVEYKILKAVREKYNVGNIITMDDFNRAHLSRFYVLDEDSHYQIEHFIRKGRVKIIRQFPSHIPGHRLLECSF